MIKNTILFKDREKERIRGEKDKVVGLWEKRKKKERVWSCQWTPQLLTYLQKDHLTTLIEN